MHRRQFLTTATAGATVLAFPAVLRAQSKEPIRIGFPLPLTGTFAAIAADLQKGAQLAMEELNAKGGVMGRKIEVLFRDDELKPAVGAQRTKELIENQKVDFVVGGLAAHNVPFLKQAISFGLKKDAKIAQPLHFLYYTKEGGAEVFQDIYGATHFCHELADTMPQAKRYVEAFTRQFKTPPDAYSGYGYNGIMEVARGVELSKSTDSDAVANALRKNREYDHYKGKQWWRACDNKSFQDLWILKVRSPQQVKGEWGLFDVIGKVAANEELDRTCAEKGFA